MGTACWPTKRPELIQYLIESLLDAEPPLPFLFATAATGSDVRADLREAVKASGRGMIVPWAPQITVLQHDAVRFFLVRPLSRDQNPYADMDTCQTHCGSGSAVETIIADMPLVAWPFLGDQPLWAAQRQSGSRLNVKT